MLKASPGRCEEASDLSHDAYIPCNAPASRMVQPCSSGEGPYRMCDQHAHHNTTNRGATDIGPFTGEGAGAPKAPADDLSAYESDAQVAPAEADNILSQITNTVRELRESQADLKVAEDAMKVAQDRVRVLEQVTLPELMRQAQQDKLRTSDGYDVELGEVLRASIPAANMPGAAAFLIANGRASIIKREFALSFGRDEADKADAALKAMLEAGLVPKDKQMVHPQTLGAAIREMLAEGIDVPMPLLGAFVQPIVKVKEAKKGR